MRHKEGKGIHRDGMQLVALFLGGYLWGCLMLQLYWRFCDPLASQSFSVAVYENAVFQATGEVLFWQLLRRDLGILSLLFLGSVFPWGAVVVGTLLLGMGCVLGVLTSGILLQEGVYWWLKSLTWMVPCFCCSGPVLAVEMYDIWMGNGCMTNRQRQGLPKLAAFMGHILVMICLAVLACKGESSILLKFFIKK